jgi:multiple antibiotic resistance protein
MGGAQTTEQKVTILISIILTFVSCLCMFVFSRRINKLIGNNGMLVLTSLMGLLLAALAVDLIARGITNMFKLLY